MRALRPCHVLLVLAPLVGCAGSAPEQATRPTPIAAEPLDPAGRLDRIRRAVDDPLRPQEDRDRDADRKPVEVLSFFGFDERMWIADLGAMDGYYTEILSSLVGPLGAVYAQNNAFVLQHLGKPLAARLTKLSRAGRVNVQRVDTELDEMRLPSALDGVLMVRFYHDLFWLPARDSERTDRAEFLRRVYESLKPGGVFAVVDHSAQAGSGDRDARDRDRGLHRIDEELVRREILAAGFVLDAESNVLRRPEDTRDWEIHSDGRRDKTDQFMLRFVKPGG